MWAKSIAAWATFSLLLIFSAQLFDYARMPWASVPYEVRHSKAELEDTAGQRHPLNRVVGDDAVVLLVLRQLATPTAVTSLTSPTATIVSLAPTDTALPATVPPPAQPTDTVSPPMPADTLVPTAAPGGEGAPATATQPASATAPPMVTSPSLIPTAEQNQAGTGSPTPAAEPVTAPAAPATQQAISTQEVTTRTAVLEGDMKDPTTYTARVAAPSGSLLDRLTRNKPSIWGNKAFYAGLAVVYVVLLAAFSGFVIRLARQSDFGNESNQGSASG